MSISSISLSNPSHRRHLGDVNGAERLAPRQAEPQRVDDDSGSATDTRGPRNPLVAAMLQAMQGLVSTAPATAPASDATGTPTTPATTSADDAASLKEAAVAFAHELFGALREAGGRAGGEGHHGWHHHGNHGDGYANLAQRLERLATKLEGSTNTSGSAATPSPTPTPLPAPATDPVAQPAPVTLADTPAADGTAPATDTSATVPTTSTPVSLPAVADGDDSTAGGIHITININLGGSGSDTSSSPLGKLKSAFGLLFKALQPTSSDTTSASDSTSDKLVTFLRSMAQSLRSVGDTASAPTRGGLVNLVA